LIKEIYLAIRFIILLLITTLVVVVALASRPEMLQYLGVKFIKENGVSFSKIDGSLLDGITIHDINYKDSILIKTLQVKYNLAMLLKPKPLIREIKIDELTLISNKLPSSEQSHSNLYILPFSISKLQMNKTRVVFNDENILFNLEASKINYNSEINAKEIDIELSTAYANAKIKGKVKSNHLYADTLISTDASLHNKYLSFLESFPNTFNLNLDASLQNIIIKSSFNDLSLSSDKNVSFNEIDVNLTYSIQNNYFSLDTIYSLSYENFASKIQQRAIFTTEGNYSTDLNASIIKKPFELPFNNISAEISGNTKNMIANIDAGSLQFDLLSKGYKQYHIKAKSERLELSFIPNLPEVLKKDVIILTADAMLDVSEFSLIGEFDSQGLYSTIKGDFELNAKARLFNITLFPKENSELFKPYKMELFSPLKLTYRDSDVQSIFNIDANMLKLTLFKKETALSGFGTFGSANFTTEGTLAGDKEANIKFSAKITSINEFISKFKSIPQDDKIFIDGNVDINATLSLSQKIKLETSINIPWYIIKTDTKTSYMGEDLHIQSTLQDNEITINKYSLDVLSHHVYSKKPSKIAFDTNATLLLKEFWIYDNLLLTGSINPTQMQGNLNLHSDNFVYNGPEGNITAKTDLKMNFESDGSQNIEGSITLLDGIITYESQTDHSLSDDIIIIQDIKEQKESKRSISIYLDALKPVVYKTKEIDVHVIPNIVIWQKPNTPISLLGSLSIEDGTITNNSKVFEFDKSEIYFSGSNPINPYINLNLHYYTLDYIDLEIFVSNTLASPVIILSSKTALSQNDIMSYILFGEPATSAFESSTDGSSSSTVGSLILATGLKQIFNDTVAIKIDTLNILTNEEGTLGYEIGTRFNKQIRIIYKSDTVSSVILQYSLSKSIRIDVDVQESAQGVNILYVKDF
jgi:translocation and assembly module TamB